jgi:hypothetical protein
MHALFTLVPIVLAAGLFGQDAPPDRRVELPGGDWPVADLIATAAAALGQPVTLCPPTLFAHALPPIRLPLPLTLDQATGSEALAALLQTRGLLLARHTNGSLTVHSGQPEALDWLAIAPTEVPREQLLDRPHAASLVHVQLPLRTPIGAFVATLAAQRAQNAPSPRLTLVDNRPGLTGTAEAVLEALDRLGALDAEFAELPEPTPQVVIGCNLPAPVHLPAGRHSIAAVLDAFASVAGVNVVMAQRLGTAALTVQVDAPLDLRRWELEPLSQLLWRHGVLVLDLDPGHALYEAVLVDSPEHAPPLHRASRRTTEEVLACADYVAFATVHYTPEHIDLAEVWRCLCAHQRKSGAGDLGIRALRTVDGVRLVGTSPELAELLRTLVAAERRVGG